MRLVLATLALALPAAGCSLIYNPNNIDKAPPDGQAPDAEPISDADPAGLKIDLVTPSQIVEGQGVDGSRQAVLVIRGENFVDGAVIQLLETETQLPHPSVSFDPTMALVSGNHRMIVVPVTANIDENDEDVSLDVVVTQAGGVTKTLASAITLHGLPVLNDANNTVALMSTAAKSTYEYAQVDITTLMFSGDVPLRIRSTSSISIDGAIAVNASGQAGGPLGGGRGGDGGAGGLGELGTKPGAAGTGLCAGAGGAVNTKGSSATLQTCSTVMDRGISNLARNVGSGGGDCSGGAVLLRAGATLTNNGTIDVSGGDAGGAGRFRFDNPDPSKVIATATYRGPMFAVDTPLITRDPVARLTFYGQANSPVKLYIEGLDNSELAAARPPVSLTVSGSSSNTYMLANDQGLFRGDNRVCLEVENADATANRPEARNCITITYVMQAGQ